ncbi:MAG: hypothetical protein JST39_03690 [Bacteroidetes bacterium]|nr:hypothetical protein [Bacteroidota bacterium]
MPNRKTDKLGFATQDPGVERDLGDRGGPALGAGIADNHHTTSRPYDEDLQTQIAAKGRKKKPQGEERNDNSSKNNQ